MPTSRVGATAPVALVKHALLALFRPPLLRPGRRRRGPGDPRIRARSRSPGRLARPVGSPTELHLIRAGSTTMDLRTLPQTKPEKFERPELEDPEPNPVELPGGPAPSATHPSCRRPTLPRRPRSRASTASTSPPGAPGHPPDTNGDVGPDLLHPDRSTPRSAIYRKSDGARVAAFTFNTFMSQGTFGNLCDTNNFGDPVVLYDTLRGPLGHHRLRLQARRLGQRRQPARRLPVLRGLEDRRPGDRRLELLLASTSPAASATTRSSASGRTASTCRPTCSATPPARSFQGTRVWALNKAQMYAGAPTVAGGRRSTRRRPTSRCCRATRGCRPARRRPGRPNYFVSTWQFLNAVGGLQVPRRLEQRSRSRPSPARTSRSPRPAGRTRPSPNAPTPGGNACDVLPDPGDDAEPVHEHRRRRVAVGHPHGAPRQTRPASPRRAGTR